ncbi:hypothetical protein CBS101457_000045 [Exobasidium rhododendri]|nr:hypothetical protein CBS101457_000045 [Exobasidium rhododendri]
MKNQVVIGMLDQVLHDPKMHDVLTLVKAARNGAVFGAKVRFPHALATVMMFGRGSLLSRLSVILQLTRQHSKVLALYAVSYKAIMIMLRNTFSNGKELSHYSLIAGGVAGAYVFGTRNPINEQLVLYAASRAMATIVIPRVKKILKARGEALQHAQAAPLANNPNLNFRIFAALSWSVAMWLYSNRRARVGQSLVGTMDYLYASCEQWDGLKSFLGV